MNTDHVCKTLGRLVRSEKAKPLPCRDVKAVRDAEEICEALRSGEYFVVPSHLTAENGAKAALIGEFHETLRDDDSEHDCDEPTRIPVSWSTIKNIWTAAIHHFEEKP